MAPTSCCCSSCWDSCRLKAMASAANWVRSLVLLFLEEGHDRQMDVFKSVLSTCCHGAVMNLWRWAQHKGSFEYKLLCATRFTKIESGKLHHTLKIYNVFYFLVGILSSLKLLNTVCVKHHINVIKTPDFLNSHTSVEHEELEDLSPEHSVKIKWINYSKSLNIGWITVFLYLTESDY